MGWCCWRTPEGITGWTWTAWRESAAASSGPLQPSSDSSTVQLVRAAFYFLLAPLLNRQMSLICKHNTPKVPFRSSGLHVTVAFETGLWCFAITRCLTWLCLLFLRKTVLETQLLTSSLVLPQLTHPIIPSVLSKLKMKCQIFFRH